MTLFECACALPRDLQPRILTLKLSLAEAFIERAERELDERAAQDVNGCFGYFPALAGAPRIVHDLPACRTFAEQLPSITVEGQCVFFNFLRRSRIRQRAQAALHLDSDAKTAITGDVSSMDMRLVLRLLLNLSTTTARRFTYADIDVSNIPVEGRDGYLFCREPVATHASRTLVLAPRMGSITRGVLLYTNRVLHSGDDDDHGHFVAAFGREDPIADCRSRLRVPIDMGEG